MKKIDQNKQPVTTQASQKTARTPGSNMTRLLGTEELKQVSGGRSGPSRRGRGH
nr:hypothetical protein [uncultured Rhodoferax sp.]